jgi:hypothetical protein
MPGVGVAPFGTLTFPGAGMPGVEFVDGVTAFGENSGGKAFALTLTKPLELVPFALPDLFVFVFESAADPQAAARKTDDANIARTFFVIDNNFPRI